jgi:hypothetical protein
VEEMAAIEYFEGRVPMNIVGKRYFCRVCGSEFVVTKGGDGQLECHAQPMEMRDAGPAQPKPTG